MSSTDPPQPGNTDRINACIDLVAKSGPDRDSIWRHRKGHAYRVVCCAIREADLVPVVVYQDEYPQGEFFDRKITLTWVRPLTEFTDGRFTLVRGPKDRLPY